MISVIKTVQSNDIPAKLVKEFDYLFFKYIATSINRCIAEGTFVNAFKKAEVRQIYKKDGRRKKLNYRSISILSNVSRSIKDAYTGKYIPILIKYFLKSMRFSLSL